MTNLDRPTEVVIGDTKQPNISLAAYEQLKQQTSKLAGGLDDYVRRGVKLFKSQGSPSGAVTYSEPTQFRVDLGSDKFWEYEQIGRSVLGETAFVLVAGGLGERLGYPEPKVKLWTDAFVKESYLQTYVEYILRCQEASGNKRKLPLIIMTSGDTHEGTVEVLKQNNNFGADPDQIIILQQEKVPAFADPQGTLATRPDGTVEMKPHGHGDVHSLIYHAKLLDKLQKDGFQWVFFFQDTNALSFRSLPISLGISKQNDASMNMLTIHRKADEPVGCVTTVKEEGGKTITMNVEYNLLENVDRNILGNLPGNANVLTIKLDPYKKVLDESKGVIPEFVNPKYNEDKTKFKKPARLEVMMQDIAKQFPYDKVVCTVLDRDYCFSTVKNNLADAKGKENPEAAVTAEGQLTANNIECLDLALKHLKKGGAAVKGGPEIVKVHGLEATLNPRVYASPRFFVSVADFVEAAQALNVDHVEFERNLGYILEKGDPKELNGTPLPKVRELTEDERTGTSIESNWRIRGYILE